jgi:hypothetical protein
MALVLLAGNPEAPTSFNAHFETTQASAAGWTRFSFSWADFVRAEWADEGGLAELDPAQVVALAFNFSAGRGLLWVDDIGLAADEREPSPQESPPTATAAAAEVVPPTATAAESPPTATPKPAEPAEPGEPAEPSGGLCSSAIVLPFAVVLTAWTCEKRRIHP